MARGRDVDLPAEGDDRRGVERVEPVDLLLELGAACRRCGVDGLAELPDEEPPRRRVRVPELPRGVGVGLVPGVGRAMLGRCLGVGFPSSVATRRFCSATLSRRGGVALVEPPVDELPDAVRRLGVALPGDVGLVPCVPCAIGLRRTGLPADEVRRVGTLLPGEATWPPEAPVDLRPVIPPLLGTE